MDFSLDNRSATRQELIDEPTNDLAKRDRISYLPDALLCIILSLLPIKSALATSIRSKRWNNVAESLSTLDFDADLMVHHHQGDLGVYAHKMRCFVEFVNHVLFLNDGKNIERFRISWFQEAAVSYLYSWVAAVVVCNVHEIDLASSMSHCIYMPSRIFGCKTLAILKLKGGFVIDLPTHVTLPNLKALHLDSVTYLGDASFEKLISSCIVLEELRIRRTSWDGVRVVNVLAPYLKRLSLWVSLFHDPEDDKYKTCITCPNLEYLELTDDITSDYSIDVMPLLVEARVDAHLRHMDGHLGSAKTLLLRGCSIKYLKKALDVYLFYNVTRLELGCTRMSRIAPWNWLIRSLGGMPNLEALEFPEGLVASTNRRRWFPPPLLPALPSCLVEVSIREFQGIEIEVDLVKYLLGQADALKEMKFHFKCGEDAFESQIKMGILRRRLQKFPRRSTTCQLNFIS